jgi:hypothetical protein
MVKTMTMTMTTTDLPLKNTERRRNDRYILSWLPELEAKRRRPIRNSAPCILS